MTKEDIIKLAREAWYAAGEGWVVEQWFHDRESALTRFAALVAAAKDEEHKEAMRWDVHSCGPTCKRHDSSMGI